VKKLIKIEKEIRRELSYARNMTIDSILAQLDSEIARLTQVRSLLANTAKTAPKFADHKVAKVATKRRKKRVLSADARKRIADAQRKRWAAQKAKSKKDS
jgi:hypothetical protein